jgi:hypothetical protein
MLAPVRNLDKCSQRVRTRRRQGQEAQMHGRTELISSVIRRQRRNAERANRILAGRPSSPRARRRTYCSPRFAHIATVTAEPLFGGPSRSLMPPRRRAARWALVRQAGWAGEAHKLRRRTGAVTECSIDVRRRVWRGAIERRLPALQGYGRQVQIAGSVRCSACRPECSVRPAMKSCAAVGSRVRLNR